jgi:hypothetical protein
MQVMVATAANGQNDISINSQFDRSDGKHEKAGAASLPTRTFRPVRTNYRLLRDRSTVSGPGEVFAS